MCYLPAFLQGKHHRLCVVYLHIKHLPRFPITALHFCLLVFLRSVPICSYLLSNPFTLQLFIFNYLPSYNNNNLKNQTVVIHYMR